MYSFSPNLLNQLNLLQQKKLNKGELFLLAKAIADSIPLPPADTENIALFTISHRSFINNVIYSLSDFTYIDEESVKTLYRIIDELTLWRYNIAYNPPYILFRGDPNTVIDDVSCLIRYVDVGDICSVIDVIDKANWMYRMFRDVAKEIKTSIKFSNSGVSNVSYPDIK